ncbi:phosphate ABC transporter, periplasmic phosphate-binding protein PstS [Geomicrobium sp. JCM 19037]|nr:phosphate ABC transporter, periplasmic phosphate-binding protein PstS [Geomicrobium sp. JCM 19037]
MVVLTLGVVQFQSYQEAQLDTITEADVEIDNYIPYANDNTLATLDKEASIQFDDDLPVLDGATALYPIYAAFAEAVYPEGTYNPDRSAVRRTQTDNAYTALLHEEVDIIFAPAPSSNQRAEAEELNVEFELTPLGREAFVFFVNETNPIESLTSEQLRSIYTGEVTNWAEVGGESGTIQAFQRPEGSGSQTALQQFIGEDELMDSC